MRRTLWFGVLVVLVLAIGTVSFTVAAGDSENMPADTEGILVSGTLSEVSPAAPQVRIVSLTCYVNGEKHTTTPGDLTHELFVYVNTGDVILFSAKVRYDGPAGSRGTWWFWNPTETNPAWQGALLKPGVTKKVTIGRPYVVLMGVGGEKEFTVSVTGPGGTPTTSRLFHFVVVPG